MSEPHPPANPDDMPPWDPPPAADATTFIVTFTGAEARNTMRLEGEGTVSFGGVEMTIEAGQVPLGAPPRRVRFMVTLDEIRRIGLHEGAIVVVVEPHARPRTSHVISFYVGSEEDAHRVLAILHPSPAAGMADDHPEAYQFFERLRAAPVFATRALLAANIAVFLLMAACGANPIEPDGLDLVRWGARLNALIQMGQWWRLLTPMFVHVGLVHLAVNMWALKALGDFIERLFGPWRFLAIYFAAGLAGNVASYYVIPEGLAAGASGAIFGILGALLGFILRHHRIIPRQALSSLGSSALSMIVLNLFFGFTIPGIDNSAHIGGLLGGIALGWLLACAPPEPAAAPSRRPGAKVMTALIAAVLVALMVAARLGGIPAAAHKELLAEDAPEKITAAVQAKFGDGDLDCVDVTLGEEIATGQYRAQALISDGQSTRTISIVIRDEGGHAVVSLP